MKFADYYFMIWCFFIPITSVVIVPVIKGSLISYIFAFISPLIFLFYPKAINKYLKGLLLFTFIFFVFSLISQLANLLFDVYLDGVILIDNENINETVFRNSFFTQSLYLIPCILTFFYVKEFYNEKWDKWIVLSGVAFAIFGFYKVIFYQLTGMDGDFLTNRLFSNSILNPTGQNIVLGNFKFQRLQSLTGEPSMYAFIMMNYLIFSLRKDTYKLFSYIIIISLLISTSTSAYLGLVIYVIYYLYNIESTKRILKNVVSLLFVAIIVYVVFFDSVNLVIQSMIIDKVFMYEETGNASGLGRYSNLQQHLFYWLELDFIHELFGIGFGFVRSDDMITTLLINSGLLGFLLYSFLMFKNFKFKNNRFVDINNSAIILVTFVLQMVAVPEFFFLSTWMFLGIIYNLNENKT